MGWFDAFSYYIKLINIWNVLKSGCAYFAYMRWNQGTDMTQFASGFENEDIGAGAGYSAYAGANEEPSYQENPFTNVAQDQMMGSGINYTAPTY